MKTQKESAKITVVIRKRPLNKKEQQKGETDIIKVEDQGSIVVSQLKQKVDLTKYLEETSFNFDFAFDENSDNQKIYDTCIQPLIDSAFVGAKVSCFAYGQTGSGKTFTMRGTEQSPGLYYLGAKQIFRYLDHPDFQHMQVNVSFFQIYCGKLYDLLNNRAELKIREDNKNNINIIGMQEKYICSAGEFMDVIEYGSTFRITSQNATNSQSSRSHAILQINIKDGKKIFTKISFIDLAGNERGADHMDQNKQTKIDGAQINKSLLALKQCIRALDQGKGHTPFRGSKLTMVLKDSFVGFCKTVMIGNVSPNVSSAENTMNTLRYADRVKQLKNTNEGGLSKQEMNVREMMLPRANKNTLKVNINRGDDLEDIQLKKEIARKNMKKNTDKSVMKNISSGEIESESQKRKTEIGFHHQDNFTKNESIRRPNPIPAKTLYSPHQDENNPKGKQILNQQRQTKQISSKTSPKGQKQKSQNISINRNKPYGIPRTEIRSQNNHKSNSQELEKLKNDFLISHSQSIKQQSYIIKQESQQCTNATRNPNFDLLNYLDSFQNQVEKKLSLFLQMKKKAEQLRSRVVESEKGKYSEKEIGFDEQLLEGLTGDQFGRLF